MALFSFLKPKSTTATTRRESAGAASAETVQQARTHARRRLIGAAVLVAIGVIGFPLLFETTPRPIPVDVPIEIPSRQGTTPLALPPSRAPATKGAVAEAPSAPAAVETPRPTPPVITERADEQGRVVAKSDAEGRAPAPATAPAVDAAARTGSVTSKPAAPSPAVAPSTTKDDGTRAKALLEGKPVAQADPKPATKQPAKTEVKPIAPATTKTESTSAAAQGGRFVVQIGAFSEASSAREARQKLEKLGLKSYTQDLEVNGQRRIRVRVGPFDDKAEAEKAAARIKAGGLPAALLTL